MIHFYYLNFEVEFRKVENFASFKKISVELGLIEFEMKMRKENSIPSVYLEKLKNTFFILCIALTIFLSLRLCKSGVLRIFSCYDVN